ncbi:MAG: flagellar filament capping protein FliD [Methylobacter sp.]|uniref:flagellar filament capping protein FliD n=1 Tax=Methylobacter sp. TaxID=2051955 RepID=UPI002730631B|nr:flagellar filament capping protein FliD [Methylobacter sp.]MDP1665056.1 flagellar filament capping protein FliD [Methylobacter sp.]
MAGITSTGLGSGIDIKSLVSSLVSAEQVPVTKRLDKQEATLTAQISSYGSLKSAMSSFQTSLSGLKYASAFQKISATSSDTAIITTSAGSNADVASYNLEVKQLAKSQTLASSSFSSATSTVGTGTLTIKFGTTAYDIDNNPTGFTQDGNQGTLSLTVDSSNNTLAGLSLAINQAKAGITASVVTDNSGSRLVLSSTKTGQNSSMEISVTNDADTSNTDNAGLSKLAYNAAAANMVQPQAAQDAILAINGLDITSSSNTVDTALKGLKLNLLQAQPGKIVTVSTSQNNDDIVTAVNSFVKGFNDLVSTVTPLTTYNTTTRKGGLLQGDPTLGSAMASLRYELGNMISGLNGSAKSLADIGISTQRDGTLALDSTRLNSQLASNRPGVTGVFAAFGNPSNSNVLFLSNTADTKAGQYAVDITQIATQGVLNGAAPSSLTIGAGNDTFSIKVDGTQSGSIALTQKTYASYAELATEIQSRINGDSALKAKGLSVGVAYDTDNNRMIFTSKSYGASSQLQITANTTNTLGLSVSTGTAGFDITGTIGGLAATGKGQILTSTAGNSTGLKLLIEGTTTGSKGTIDFSRGLIERLDKVMTGALSKTGTFTNRTNGLQKNIDQITKQRTELADRMSSLEERLYKRFNRMDAMLGRMQSTASYLTQQFAPKTSTY